LHNSIKYYILALAPDTNSMLLKHGKGFININV